jgi:hypothetical protein
LVSNPFSDIVGPDFSCLKEPTLSPDKCPGSSYTEGGPRLDDDFGEWYCPVCGAVFDLDEAPENEFFDDDEDEAFDNDEVFVAEGDRALVQSAEDKARVDRYNALNELSSAIGPFNEKLSRRMESIATEIIELVRQLEVNFEPAFTGRLLKPKLLAVALFLFKERLDAKVYRTLRVNQNTTEAGVRTLTLLRPKVGELDPVVDNIRFVGNALNLPPGVIVIIIEQYEESGRPPNREEDYRTRAAAWIYLMAQPLGLGVTKANTKRIGGVKQNAFDRAVESYSNFIAKRNKQDEGVEMLDD